MLFLESRRQDQLLPNQACFEVQLSSIIFEDRGLSREDRSGALKATPEHLLPWVVDQHAFFEDSIFADTNDPVPVVFGTHFFAATRLIAVHFGGSYYLPWRF